MTISPHSFHIPVMGTGFTIDTPLRVARYGISSVISLVDDQLIEQMRRHHCEVLGEPYEEIGDKDDDPRAHRITTYLNMVDRLVQAQVRELQAAPFTDDSDLTRYFRMLPETPLKQMWQRMRETADTAERAKLDAELRTLAVPGAIDVNIMTKLDRPNFRNGEQLPPEYGDALAALRGFANSTLSSSVVMSAGLYQRLYGYMTQFADFLPGDDGSAPRKKIILKVSDHRSAIVQGKFLAKRGLWVSEFRIESGLNCGGHAFASVGMLMGPILEEFKRERTDLIQTLYEIYSKALETMGRPVPRQAPDLRITFQGGVGTSAEHNFLMQYYEIDGVGWGTPFLLVPEVVNIDEKHLERVSKAGDNDVYLSDTSPLGIPFWSLRTSESEAARRQRIADGRPGSPCPKGYLVSTTEFTKRPICTASTGFQKQKLKQLDEMAVSPELEPVMREAITAKACICHDLAGGAAVKHGFDKEAVTAVCCGPNIVNFSKVATLEEMIGHIYGRISLMTNPNRPHVMLRELKLYIDYLRSEMEKWSLDLSSRTPKYFTEFRENLHAGIEYYRGLSEVFESKKESFLRALETLQSELEQLPSVEAMPPSVS